jgi:hypothetical protein
MKAVENRSKFREDNPEKLWVNMLTNHTYGWSGLGLGFWMAAFGTHQELRSGGRIGRRRRPVSMRVPQRRGSLVTWAIPIAGCPL